MCTAMEIVNGCVIDGFEMYKRWKMKTEESLETEFHLLSHVLHYQRCRNIAMHSTSNTEHAQSIDLVHHQIAVVYLYWEEIRLLSRIFVKRQSILYTCINCVWPFSDVHILSSFFFWMNILSIQVTFKQYVLSVHALPISTLL